MSEKYKNLKVKELQELLQKNGLPHTGKKEELIDRLVKHDKENAELASLEEEFGDLEEFDDAKLALDDIEDTLEPVEEKKPEQVKSIPSPKETTTPTTTPTTTTTTTTATKTKSEFKFTPIVFDKKPETVEKKKEEKPKLPVVPPKVTNDAEKALERAKRFGTQLNESTKKDIRAQRFGTSTTTTTTAKTTEKSTPKVKGIDPEVLKKRAERFGLAKPGNKVPVTLDPTEEEKKRKRAERFQLQSDAAKKLKAE